MPVFVEFGATPNGFKHGSNDHCGDPMNLTQNPANLYQKRPDLAVLKESHAFDDFHENVGFKSREATEHAATFFV